MEVVLSKWHWWTVCLKTCEIDESGELEMDNKNGVSMRACVRVCVCDATTVYKMSTLQPHSLVT